MSPDPEDPSDEALLATYVEASTAAARDAAFHALVDRYERRVHAICYRYFGDHADAEDATQDTFLHLARKADQFRRDSKLSTWIYRIATNACHDLARKDARRPRTPVADVAAVADHEDPGVSTEEAVEASSLADDVQAALLQLDELSRTLIVLCAIEGQSYAEVSAALDLPVGTIKSRVFRARARLGELLAPVMNDPEELASPRPIPPRADGTGAGPGRSPRAPPG